MSINDGRLDGRFGSSEGDILAASDLVDVQVSDPQMAECMALRRSTTREFLQPKNGAIEILSSLQNMGFALGLVTDCVFDVPAVWAGTEFAPYFSAMHFSCETQVRKPNERAYRGVLESLGVAPDQALFVGDGGSDELNGDVKVGMDAVMIDDMPDGGVDMLRVGFVERTCRVEHA